MPKAIHVAAASPPSSIGDCVSEASSAFKKGGGEEGKNDAASFLMPQAYIEFAKANISNGIKPYIECRRHISIIRQGLGNR